MVATFGSPKAAPVATALLRVPLRYAEALAVKCLPSGEHKVIETLQVNSADTGATEHCSPAIAAVTPLLPVRCSAPPPPPPHADRHWSSSRSRSGRATLGSWSRHGRGGWPSWAAVASPIVVASVSSARPTGMHMAVVDQNRCRTTYAMSAREKGKSMSTCSSHGAHWGRCCLDRHWRTKPGLDRI